MYLSFISQSSLVQDINIIASKNFLFAADADILDLENNQIITFNGRC